MRDKALISSPTTLKSTVVSNKSRIHFKTVHCWCQSLWHVWLVCVQLCCGWARCDLHVRMWSYSQSANRRATPHPVERKWAADLILFWLVKCSVISPTLSLQARMRFLCLPSDMSSSSKRLMPVFWVRVCRLECSGLDAAVPADVLSPIRSTRAELVLPSSDKENTHQRS